MEQLTEDTATTPVPQNVIDFALASTYAEIELRFSAEFRSDEERGHLKVNVRSPQQREQDMLWESYMVGWPWVVTTINAETMSGTWAPSNICVGYISHFSNQTDSIPRKIDQASLVATYPQGPPFSMVLSSPNQPGLLMGLCMRSDIGEDITLEIRRKGLALASQWIQDWCNRETTKAVNYRALPNDSWTGNRLLHHPHNQTEPKKQQDYDWYARAVSKLEELSALPENWNGYEAHTPNQLAITRAKLFLDELKSQDLEPSRILASAANGVSFCFFRPKKYAEIECYNTGESVAIIKNTSNNWREIWEIQSIQSAVGKIQDFLESGARR